MAAPTAPTGSDASPGPDDPGRVGPGGPGTQWAAGVRAAWSGLAVMAGGLVLVGVLIPGAPDKYRELDPAAPVSLSVPSLQISAPVSPVAVSAERVLDPPQDPLQVGWWQASARPGASSGQTVITGHTVHTGGGAMDAIHDVEPGRRIDVATSKGLMRYEVADVQVLTKDELAADAQELFGQDRGDGGLVLVSCDDWNGSFYESNVVVIADPLGEPIPKKEQLAQS